ncbi:Ras-domain-containing protein [Mycena indigotica]|uniref:Ras-domain-containing protein n=1 Tax=Mycena indigotica TaxID=2126181 RepID=A0A8H6W632_9AGAR|nr:Ras-domain-containing protein [Mycena indigotica]KAF7304216.1 Ras-domain-containing protein [Mycena indigotica]
MSAFSGSLRNNLVGPVVNVNGAAAAPHTRSLPTPIPSTILPPSSSYPRERRPERQAKLDPPNTARQATAPCEDSKLRRLEYGKPCVALRDAAVGKSSLLVRLTDQRFLANPDPTLGVEFGSKLLTLQGPGPHEGTVVKLQCWDTAGTESFRSITRSYYRGAAGCLLVYDVTSRKSFDNVRMWLADVRAHADAHVSCILVGNKVDLCEGDGAIPRAVPKELAQQFANDEGLLFTEASARSGDGVEDAFMRAAEEIIGKVRGGKFDDARVSALSPHIPTPLSLSFVFHFCSGFPSLFILSALVSLVSEGKLANLLLVPRRQALQTWRGSPPRRRRVSTAGRTTTVLHLSNVYEADGDVTNVMTRDNDDLRINWRVY